MHSVVPSWSWMRRRDCFSPRRVEVSGCHGKVGEEVESLDEAWGIWCGSEEKKTGRKRTVSNIFYNIVCSGCPCNHHLPPIPQPVPSYNIPSLSFLFPSLLICTMHNVHVLSFSLLCSLKSVLHKMKHSTLKATVKSQQVIVQLSCWAQGQPETVVGGGLHCMPNLAEQWNTPNPGPVWIMRGYRWQN